LERQKGFIEVLQNEVKQAKTILGSQHMRDQAIVDLNFDRVYRFDHKPDLEQALIIADKSRKDCEKNFNPNKVKIVTKSLKPNPSRKYKSLSQSLDLDTLSEV
jgi:hypothetical protein